MVLFRRRPWSLTATVTAVLFSLTTGSSSVLAQQNDCYSTINAISLREGLLSSADALAPRVYVLCPGTFDIGALDYNFELQDGQDMLALRSNMRITCGDSGVRENGCFVRGGDVQVDGTSLFTVPDGTLENVMLEGITFVNTTKHMVWINKPGNIVFKDCVFRDNTQALAAPVMLDYFDPKAPASELAVTFYNCLFTSNTFFGRPAQSSLVVGNSRQNRLIFERCLFSNNDMVSNNRDTRTSGFLVESNGPISMIGNCFEDNRIGYSTAAIYNEEHFLVDNFGRNSTGRPCALASIFETGAQFDNFAPICTTFDMTACAIEGSARPTLAPTSSPTAPTNSPTDAPTLVQSTAPSISAVPTGATRRPTVSPSNAPSGIPSFVPSGIPSVIPSAAPSGTASAGPSAVPSGLPSLGPSAVPSGLPSIGPSTSASPTQAPVFRTLSPATELRDLPDSSAVSYSCLSAVLASSFCLALMIA